MLQRLALVTITALFLLSPLPALAHGMGSFDIPDGDLAIGPSIAWLPGDAGWSLNLDTSMTWALFSASINAKMIRTSEENLYGLQGELTIWLFVVLGGGAGYLGGDQNGVVAHLFAGLPIPLEQNDLFGLDGVFVEPYYRPNFFFGPGDVEVFHEVGIFFKGTTWDL